MNHSSLLAQNRIRIARELKDSPRWKYFSPAIYAASKITQQFILQYAHGSVIDLGCGTAQYKKILLTNQKVTSYHTLDIEKRTEEVDIVGDIQNMYMLSDESYDTILCLQVLEHVPNPFQAMEEMRRILKKDGVLILSVPHLSRLHEEPNDYYRYTKYGLEFILQKVGLKNIEISPMGSLFSFIGHQISMIIVVPFWHIPLLKHVAYFINKWLVTLPCVYVDALIGKNNKFPAGYLCISKK